MCIPTKVDKLKFQIPQRLNPLKSYTNVWTPVIKKCVLKPSLTDVGVPLRRADVDGEEDRVLEDERSDGHREEEGHAGPVVKVARWQNLIPSFPWIAPGWRAWGRNPREGRDQILQRSVAEP